MQQKQQNNLLLYLLKKQTIVYCVYRKICNRLINIFRSFVIIIVLINIAKLTTNINNCLNFLKLSTNKLIFYLFISKNLINTLKFSQNKKIIKDILKLLILQAKL